MLHIWQLYFLKQMQLEKWKLSVVAKSDKKYFVQIVQKMKLIPEVDAINKF